MRKLAWFLIILAILTPTIIAAGLAYPPFGEGLHYVFITVIGEGAANLATQAVIGLFVWGSVNGLQAAAVLIGIWIVGGVMWVAIKRFLWDRRPSIIKKAETKIYQHEPTPSLPQVSSEPVPQAISAPKLETKPEPVKEEVVAT